MFTLVTLTQLLLLLLLIGAFSLFVVRILPPLTPMHWLYLSIGVMVTTVSTLTLLGIIYANDFLLVSAVMVSLVAFAAFLLLFVENAVSKRDQ